MSKKTFDDMEVWQIEKDYTVYPMSLTTGLRTAIVMVTAVFVIAWMLGGGLIG